MGKVHVLLAAAQLLVAARNGVANKGILVIRKTRGLLFSSRPVIAATALVAVLGITGTAYGAKLITGLDIKDGSITAVDLSKGAHGALKGDKGARGAIGIGGSRGAKGTAGVVGVAGPLGPIGAASTAPGPQGLIGVTGNQGNPGPQGSIGAASTVQGPAGVQGATGAQGSTGSTGAASTVQGPAGVQGATGAQGCRRSLAVRALRVSRAPRARRDLRGAGRHRPCGTTEGATCTVPGGSGTIHWSNTGGSTWQMACINVASACGQR